MGIFSGMALSVKGQTNVRTERIDAKTRQNTEPRFITVTEAGETDQIKSSQSPTTPPAFYKPGYVANIELCTAMQFKYALLMETEVESITNLPLFNFIEEWWGTSYKYGGNDRSGIDCSSFTCKLLSEVYGLSAPRTSKEQYNKCEVIPTEDLVEGNLVFFNTSGGVSHVGLYLGNNYFVHSSTTGGVTISNLTEEYYSKRFISGGRIMMPPTPLASVRK